MNDCVSVLFQVGIRYLVYNASMLRPRGCMYLSHACWLAGGVLYMNHTALQEAGAQAVAGAMLVGLLVMYLT